MSINEDIIIVPIIDFCFETAKTEGYYAFPESSTRKEMEKIAFYRVSPISAITHIADVTGVTKGDEVDGTYRIIAFGDKVDEEAVVFYLNDLRKLDEPIECDEIGIQAPIYAALSVEKAEVISDLMNTD
jgi:hypothetical protein